ncbi:unnamed protein product [Strongylus vulgaris]|uniref:DNA mitochondrial polymerase exonuclease domain-containing protein n=1 Tax=Strongylus vulgaris TaxID=40348 RepID=A0A3P7JQD2_STRVU|nr:unnamed protein product [Strongylus vulgaris]
MADHQVATYETDDSDYNLREKRSERWRDAWDDRVCRNSLLAVHQHLYRDEYRITKEAKKYQEFFVKEDLNSVRENFQVLVNYCADDNLICSQIFKKLWPEFQKRFPHPATLYGILNIGNAYLPINENWERFFKKNEKISDETKEAGARALIASAKDIMTILKPNSDGVVMDAWLFDADWSYKGNKEFPEWFYKLFSKRGNVYLDFTSLSCEDVIMKSTLAPLIFETDSDEHDSLFKTPQQLEHICKVIAENKIQFGDITPVGRTHKFGSFLFYQLSHPVNDIDYRLEVCIIEDLHRKIICSWLIRNIQANLA